MNDFHEVIGLGTRIIAALRVSREHMSEARLRTLSRCFATKEKRLKKNTGVYEGRWRLEAFVIGALKGLRDVGWGFLPWASRTPTTGPAL